MPLMMFARARARIVAGAHAVFREGDHNWGNHGQSAHSSRSSVLISKKLLVIAPARAVAPAPPSLFLREKWAYGLRSESHQCPVKVMPGGVRYGGSGDTLQSSLHSPFEDSTYCTCSSLILTYTQELLGSLAKAPLAEIPLQGKLCV